MRPWPRIQTAVPRTLHARQEIAKAIRTIAAEEDDRLLRRRHAATALLRQDFDQLAQSVHELCRRLNFANTAPLQKYSPDQPRVPAGHSDGGQWTNGEAGTGSPSDFAGATSDPSRPSARYAAQLSDTLTDTTDSGGDTGGAGLRDGHTFLGNLHDVVAAALWRKYRVIGADQIPADHPKHPVQFLDSSNRPILDEQGRPILRPANLPPEAYVEAGLAATSLAVDIHQFNEALRAVANGLLKPSAVIALGAEVASKLLPLAHGGSLDAERYDSNYVRDYRHYTSIATGIFMAAAEVSREDALTFADSYASLSSKFGSGEHRHEVYTHSAKQDIEDNLKGYDLYESGRIGPGR